MIAKIKTAFSTVKQLNNSPPTVVKLHSNFSNFVIPKRVNPAKKEGKNEKKKRVT